MTGSVDAWFDRLDGLSVLELDQFAALLLAAVAFESSSAPAQVLSGEPQSGGKPESSPPRAVGPGCSCGCRDEVSHWGRVFSEARAADESAAVNPYAAGRPGANLRGAVLVAYRSLRPAPGARAAAVEDSSDREKRVLAAYVGVSPEEVALQELALHPWGERPSGMVVRWNADAVRKLRRQAQRHPETGEREDPEEELAARAQKFRDGGMSLRKIGERVGRNHMWVDRHTVARQQEAA